MKIKYLYHGSRKLIKGKYIKTNLPKDKTQKENYLNAVYATDRIDIALGMGLTGTKYTKSFGDYHKKPFKVIFVRGKPKGKFVYIYKVSSKTFKEKPRNSHQWISFENIQIISVKKYLIKNLDNYWRKTTSKEKNHYYKKIRK